MSDKAEFELCRLCLNSRGLLINVFGEDSKLRIMLVNTIGDLIDVQVVEDENYPWLVCSNCMEKLTEFRLFKRRCAECLLVFNNRIQKECSPTTKDWINNEKGIDVNAITSDNVDVQDDMIIVKEEIDTASGCSVPPLKDDDLSLVSSMQVGCSYWSDNKEAGNMDCSEDTELHLSSHQGMDNKEMCYMDISQKEGLRGVVLQSKDECQGQDVQERGTGNILQTCQICSKPFKTRDLLKAHVMSVHLEKGMLFKCDVCSDSFECKSDLHGHVTLHHTMKPVNALKKKHHCKHCSRQFRDRSGLRVHMLTHSGEKPFKCTICSKTFTQNCNLTIHMLTHSGEKSHKCSICSKSFRLNGHLKSHMLVHTGERSFKCSICSKAFALNGNLKNHMLKHSGEKIFKCEICPKTFARNCDLKSHILTHTGQKSYNCEICSKAFTHKSYLKVHSLKHTDERQHKCVVCLKAFKFKSTLNKHKDVHKQVKTD